MTYGAELQDFQARMARPLEQLQHLVGKLDYDGISSFFRQYMPRDINYSSKCSMLAHMIVQKHDFFQPYHLGGDNCNDGDENKVEKLKKEHMLRYSYVLNHLAIHSQLFVLTHLLQHQKNIDVNIDYFQATQFHFEKLNEKSKESFLALGSWGKIMNTLFRSEHFDLIDNLEKQFDCSFLTQRSKEMILYYVAEPPAQSAKKMMFYYTDTLNQNQFFETYEKIDLEQKIFKPYFYIVFDYSQKKEEYLHQKGIKLPSVAEVQKIEVALNNALLFTPDVVTQKNKWMQQLKQYEKRICYYELDSHIEAIHGSSNNHDDNETSGKLKI